MKLDPYLTTLTKINPKWIKELNIRPDTIKLEGNLGKKPINVGLGNNFLSMMPKARATKEKNSQMQLHQN